MRKRLAGRSGTCRKPCLRRRSLPASQGAPQASLPLEFALANAPAQETTFQGQQMARLSNCDCLQTQRTTTRHACHRQSRHKGKTTCHPHQGTKPNKQRRFCIGLCPAACPSWRARFSADPSTDAKCIAGPVRHLAFPSTHSVTTFSWIRWNGKIPSISSHAGHMTVYPRTEQMKAKAVPNTRLGRGVICMCVHTSTYVHPFCRPRRGYSTSVGAAFLLCALRGSACSAIQRTPEGNCPSLLLRCRLSPYMYVLSTIYYIPHIIYHNLSTIYYLYFKEGATESGMGFWKQV